MLFQTFLNLHKFGQPVSSFHVQQANNNQLFDNKRVIFCVFSYFLHVFSDKKVPFSFKINFHQQ